MTKLYSNYIGELTDESVRETYKDPVTATTLPRYSFRFGTSANTSGSGLTFTWCNEIQKTAGSATSNGSLTPVSTYQCYSAHTNGIEMSGNNYKCLYNFGVLKNLSDEEHSYEKNKILKSLVDYTRYPLKLYYKRMGASYDIKSVNVTSVSLETFTYYYNGNQKVFTDMFLNWSVMADFNQSYPNHYIDFTIPEFPDISVSGGTTPTETATISISLDNASCNIDPNTEYTIGSTVAIIVTPDSGHVFTTAPKFNGTVMNAVGDGSYYANATITSTNAVTGSAVVTQTVTISETLENCSSDISGLYSVGDTIAITLTCDDGYIFNEFPVLNARGLVYSFSLSEDYKKAYISHKITGDFTISGSAVLSSENVYGFYAVYEPNDVFLKNFAKNHVYEIHEGTITEYDLTPFIYNIYKLPFNVEQYTRHEQVSDVQFYKYTYRVPTEYIPDDGHIFTIDFGVINVPKLFNNRYDYDCSVSVEIPFFSLINIDSHRCVGSNIHVIGTVNLYDRTMTVDIYDDNGAIITESKQQIGYNFPIVTNTFKQTGDYSDELSNNLTSARVVRDYSFSIKTINDLIGTVYADDVKLIGFTGTDSEREQLEDIIKGGIHLE